MAYRPTTAPTTRSLVGAKELLMVLFVMALVAVPIIAAVTLARQLMEVASSTFGG